MKSLLNLLFAFALLVGLSSCGEQAELVKFVDNQTSEKLIITAQFNGEEIKVKEFESGEAEYIYCDVQKGSLAEANYDCTSRIESFQIKTQSGEIVEIDALNSENWISENSSQGKMSRENCTLIITESNLLK